MELIIMGMMILSFIGIFMLMYGEIKELKNKNKDLSQLKVKDYWLIRKRIELMEPNEFEEFCTNIWRHIDGHKARKTPTTGDGGKDVVLKANGQTIFIEAKHWTDQPVGREVAQKLKGAMMFGEDGKTPVTKGIIMTTSSFTDECIEYCNAMGIEMWDLNAIMRLVEKIGTQNVYADVGINYDGRYIYE